MNFQYPTAPSSISHIFANGWRLYKKIVFKILPFVLLMSIICQPLFMWSVKFLSIHRQTVSLGLRIALMVIPLLLVFYFFVAVYYKIYIVSVERDKKIGKVLGEVFLKFGTIITAKFIAVLFLSIISAAFLLLAILPGLIIAKGSITAIYSGIVIAGSIVVVIGAAVFISQIMPNVLIKNYGSFKAFVNSLKLVYGNFWRTFFVFSMLYLVQAILYDPFYFIISHYMRQNLSLYLMSIMPIVVLNSIFLMTWMFSVLLCLYHDLRARADGKITV